MARGRDLMRFYCLNDVTGAIVQAVVEWKTLDSIYRSTTIPFQKTSIKEKSNERSIRETSEPCNWCVLKLLPELGKKAHMNDELYNHNAENVTSKNLG